MGVAERCRFQVQDLSNLDVGEKFDLVLGVTVLQHILDPGRLRAALGTMTAHLAPGGRMILLEAAPTDVVNRCDTTVFRARHRDVYLSMMRAAGLELRALTGVDPAPFGKLLLPHIRGLPADPVAQPARAGDGTIVARRCAVRPSAPSIGLGMPSLCWN